MTKREQIQIQTIVPRPRTGRGIYRVRAPVYCNAPDFYEPEYIGGSRALRLPTADEQARGRRDDED